jgi:hypothetical protein
VSNSRSLFLIVVVIGLMFVGSASANIRLSSDRILFDNTTGDVPYANLSDAYTAIVEVHP